MTSPLSSAKVYGIITILTTVKGDKTAFNRYLLQKIIEAGPVKKTVALTETDQ